MSRKTHIVPTHLRTPETLLSIAGFSLSIRQFLLLLLGAALSYDLWLQLGKRGVLAGGVGLIVRFLLAVLPVLLAGTLAFLRLAGRTLDRWAFLALSYLARPRRFVWRSIRYQEPAAFGMLNRAEEVRDAQV